MLMGDVAPEASSPEDRQAHDGGTSLRWARALALPALTEILPGCFGLGTFFAHEGMVAELLSASASGVANILEARNALAEYEERGYTLW